MAALAPVVDCFRATALFEMAGYPVVERVAATSRLIDVDPGAVVVAQGAAAATVHVIEAGRLRVTVDSAGDTRTVNEMGPGDWFGEIGVVGQRPRTATVVAETAARVWSIPGPAFLEAVASSATVADRLGRGDAGSPRSHEPGTGDAMNVGALVLRVRVAVRHRRMAALGLAVLVAVGVGVVLTLAAGARRTASAPDRYTAAVGGDVDTMLFQPNGRPQTDAVRALPVVQELHSVTFLTAGVDGADRWRCSPATGSPSPGSSPAGDPRPATSSW